ncbi:uncharacterized protein IUM83_07294 [Phytophthora cinnamomi]|uniref:uncharacterized protein n=1 Tax=Phytophthora cinnamomi TaxID=4785 RepID=UPI00355AAA1F|nr:transmembrane protein [Phytophthora cinnamomi]
MQRYSLPQPSYQTSNDYYSRSDRLLDASNRYRGSVDSGRDAAPLLPGDGYGAYASMTQTRHQLQHQHRQHHRASSSSGGSSSLPVVAAAAELDEADEYALQLLAYRVIYVLQGAFMGILGPALVFFSALAAEQSGLNAPVHGFGTIFAAHGGAALVMSFMSDFVLTGAWYACLTPVAAATGNVGSAYFIAKGFWTALLNITLNRCSLWIAGEKDPRRRGIITSLNINYGLAACWAP